MYGSTFASMSPGRNPSRSPASTAGRVRMMRPTCRSDSAATASAIARYVLPVPAGPIANVTIERTEHGVDGRRPDVVSALDELDQFVDDRARLGDALVFALEGQLIPPQPDRAAQPVAQRLEDAVRDARELCRDLVRDCKRLLHAVSVGVERSTQSRRDGDTIATRRPGT